MAPVASKIELLMVCVQVKIYNGEAVDFAALLNKQMEEEFKSMLLKSQQKMTSRLEVTQNQSENRFSKIEADLVMSSQWRAKWFDEVEVEKRIVEKKTSSQASVAKLRMVEEFLQ